MKMNKAAVLHWTAALSAAAFTAGSLAVLSPSAIAQERQEEQQKKQEYRRATPEPPAGQGGMSGTNKFPGQTEGNEYF